MAEETHSNADFNAYNGDGFLEQFEQPHQFDLGREFERHSNVDSTGCEIKHVTSHYDSSSSGLVQDFDSFIFFIPFFVEERSGYHLCKYMHSFRGNGFGIGLSWSITFVFFLMW